MSDAEPEEITSPGVAFDILQSLALGGAAEIYIARRHGASQLCALKRLRREKADHPVARIRLRREAALAARLAHPNIARLIETGSSESFDYLAMELIDGYTITEIRKRAEERGVSIPLDAILHLALKVLDALAYAHQLNDDDGHPLQIVHRDLSPSNILVARTGEVKVIDFGVARSTIDDFRTAPDVRLGTLRYMSPEQAQVEEVDSRSDIYSFGIVLFELASGRRLITAKSGVDVLEAIVHTPAPRLESIVPGFPEGAAEAIAKALRKVPEQRFADAQAFSEALIQGAAPIQPASQAGMTALIDRLFGDDPPRWTFQSLEDPAKVPESTVVLVPDLEPTSELPTVAVEATNPEERRARWQVRLVGGLFVVFAVTATVALQLAPVSGESDPSIRAEDQPREPRAVQEFRIGEPRARPRDDAQLGDGHRDDVRVNVPHIRRPVTSKRVLHSPEASRASTLGPLRARLEELSQTSDPNALVDMRDRISRQAADLEDPKDRVLVDRELARFERGGGIDALKGALEALEDARAAR